MVKVSSHYNTGAVLVVLATIILGAECETGIGVGSLTLAMGDSIDPLPRQNFSGAVTFFNRARV